MMGVVDIEDMIMVSILNLGLNLDAARRSSGEYPADEDYWYRVLNNIILDSGAPIVRDPADVNGNGVVDIVDLVLVAGALGNAGGCAFPIPSNTRAIHGSRGPRMATPSTTIKSHKSNITTRYSFFKATLSSFHPTGKQYCYLIIPIRSIGDVGYRINSPKPQLSL